MHLKIKKAILTAYTILLCLSIVLTGICLIAECLNIYYSGDRPYSSESVAKAFSQISAVVYFCGIMVLAGFFLKAFIPVPRKKAEKNYPLILMRLEQTTDISLCPKQLQDDFKKLNSRKRIISILSLLLLAAGSILFLCYGANPNNFHKTEINISMVKAMQILIPSMAVPFAFGIFAAYYDKYITRKKIELLKSAPIDAKKTASNNAEAQPSIAYLRWSILIIAVLLLGFGYFIGGAQDVLTKAVNICTECIGLG